MRLQKVIFDLENCEQITIDGKYAGDFYLSDIRTEISRIACNAIEKMDICHTFAIEIHKDANKKYCPFGQEDWKKPVFDRLVEHDDITHITAIIDTPISENEWKTEEYTYIVNWEGDSDYQNAAQCSKISSSGHLYIVIDDKIAEDKKRFEDFFSEEEINDEEVIDLHMDLCDVGDVYGNLDRYKKSE